MAWSFVGRWNITHAVVLLEIRANKETRKKAFLINKVWLGFPDSIFTRIPSKKKHFFWKLLHLNNVFSENCYRTCKRRFTPNLAISYPPWWHKRRGEKENAEGWRWKFAITASFSPGVLLGGGDAIESKGLEFLCKPISKLVPTMEIKSKGNLITARMATAVSRLLEYKRRSPIACRRRYDFTKWSDSICPTFL